MAASTPSGRPSAQIALALERVLDRTSRNGPVALQYGPTEGLEELRTLLAPGTAGSPALGPVDRVLVTTGSQQALELVVRAVVDPGDRVVVEDPLYLGTRQVLDGYGADLLAIPVDRDGLDVGTAVVRPHLVEQAAGQGVVDKVRSVDKCDHCQITLSRSTPLVD